MLTQRILVILILLPLIVGVVYLGGWLLVGFTVLVMLIGAWEYWRMFHQNGLAPSLPLLMGGILAIILSRAFFQFDGSEAVISAVLMAAAFVHIIQYERGNQQAATNFALTLAGILYLGWTFTYLISLRDLPDGTWWTLLILASTALADGGAYLFGRRWGKHKMSHRVSPKKSWEGYVGGVVFSILFTSFFAYLWSYKAASITVPRGILVALIMSLFPTFGDLTISLIKRQCGVKDTSHIIPGHGGILDRTDSFHWALPIGYYLVTWFFL